MESKRARDIGVSEVIGFLLVIAISLSAAGLYQVDTIPKQELSTEVTHEATVVRDMSELRQNILFTSASGNGRTTNVQLGTRYNEGPSFFVYSLPPSGTLSTVDASNYPIEIHNAEGLGSAENYWSGEVQGDEPSEAYTTKFLRYSVDYTEYSADPTLIYENTVLYEEYNRRGSSTQILQTDQSVVDGTNINLLMIGGEVDQTAIEPASVETKPVSANPNTISITNTGGGPIQIYMPTTLTVETWNNRILDTEGRVEAFSAANDPNPNDEINYIYLEFEEDITYQLTMSKVYISTQSQSTSSPTPSPAYVGWKGNDDITVRENSRLPINAEVRDKYNNPAGGAVVEATARDGQGDCIGDFQSAQDTSGCPQGQYFQPGEQTSGDDGEVQFVYEAPEVSSDRQININLCIGDGCSSNP